MTMIPDIKQNNRSILPVTLHQLRYQKCALGIRGESNMTPMHNKNFLPSNRKTIDFSTNGKIMQNIQDSGPEIQIRGLDTEPKYLTIVNSHFVMVIHYEGSFLL